MFMLPGAIYVDPELSWRYEIGPAGTTFVKGTALGPEYDGTLWMGSARAFSQVLTSPYTRIPLWRGGLGARLLPGGR